MIFLHTRDFEDGSRAFRYARTFHGYVELMTPLGEPHFYRVWVLS